MRVPATRPAGRWFVWMLLALGGCSDSMRLPWAPAITAARPGNTSARIGFSAPLYAGTSAIAAYVASCTRADETITARGEASPIVVFGLRNGAAYGCTVRASNASGMGPAAATFTVTPQPEAADSLAAAYQRAAWAAGLVVTFPSACSMSVWPNARPSHPIDAVYLTPVAASAGDQQPRSVAVTGVSAMALAVSRTDTLATHAPMQFNICPTQAPSPTATNAGAIGVMISGAVLFGAAEVSGSRATAQRDNVAYRWRDGAGVQRTAGFLDRCNGHPTPGYAGSIYHYHGHSDCVTGLVDRVDGPSHLIGIALDGFPIYGDRDMDGKTVPPQSLDSCNGIHSPTPEFPQGVYHYVLPAGVTQQHAAMRCYSGAVSREALALADSSGYCYAPRTTERGNAAATMVMGGAARR